MADENSRPPEDDPVAKVNLVMGFVRKKLGKSKKLESLITNGLDYFFNYFQSLKAIVERVKHKSTTRGSTIQKDEADRVVAYVFLWLADVIQLLDRTGFDWSKVVKEE